MSVEEDLSLAPAHTYKKLHPFIGSIFTAGPFYDALRDETEIVVLIFCLDGGFSGSSAQDPEEAWEQRG